jgi:hypothetical protein
MHMQWNWWWPAYKLAAGRRSVFELDASVRPVCLRCCQDDGDLAAGRREAERTPLAARTMETLPLV